MKSTFAGFPREMPRFLRDLEKNNNRDWFEAHKQTYLEAVKAPMEDLAARVGAELMRFAPHSATEPRRAIYRIYRDTRFSPDKTPYKTHCGASFWHKDMVKHEGAGYYFEVSHRHVGIAGGVYMPPPENLRLLRAHILENHSRFAKMLAEKKLSAACGELQGERLSRPPKGFPADHPATEWLKLKQMYFWVELPAKLALEPGVAEEIVTRFRLMTPVMDFLNEPLLAMKKKRAPLEEGWL
jgi:uncharacterized protein (TIGR02453 family)